MFREPGGRLDHQEPPGYRFKNGRCKDKLLTLENIVLSTNGDKYKFVLNSLLLLSDMVPPARESPFKRLARFTPRGDV